MRISTVKPRNIATKSLLLEILGKDATPKADTLAKPLREIFEENSRVRITCPED